MFHVALVADATPPRHRDWRTIVAAFGAIDHLDPVVTQADASGRRAFFVTELRPTRRLSSWTTLFIIIGSSNVISANCLLVLGSRDWFT